MLIKLNLLKHLNTTTVLKYIIKSQPLSRADISSGIGMNKASVSEIIRELIDANLVSEVGMGSSTKLGGRKPVLLTFNYEAGVSIGVDIGVNSIRFLITLLNGRVLYQKKVFHDPVKRVKIISDFLGKQEKLYDSLPYGIIGVTISIHGMVHENKILFTPNYDVYDLEQLVGNFNYPIYFENEANLAAYSHAYLNEPHDDNIASITLRSGVGSGIIYDKLLYKGYQSGAGELGHTIVVPNGLKCSCGNKGCLEQYVSEKSIVREFNRKMQRTDLKMSDFVKEYNKDNPIALKLLEQATEFLSIGINNFIALFAIEKIYLVGNLTTDIDKFPELIKSKITSVFSEDIHLLNSPYEKYASAMGACYLGIDKFINADQT